MDVYFLVYFFTLQDYSNKERKNKYNYSNRVDYCKRRREYMSTIIIRNALLRVAMLVVMLFGIYKFVQWFVAG